MTRPTGVLAGLAVAAALLAGACSSDGSDASSASTTAGPSSSTTSPSSSTTGSTEATTTTATPATAAIVLRGDGLGVVSFGASPEEAIPAVSAELGEPTADTGWEPSFSAYGTCPGEQIRGVEWDALVLLFTDGETTYGAGPHLFAWRLTGAPPALGTAEGFGFGATVDDAEQLFPGAAEVTPADEPFPGFVQVDADGGTITGYLDDAGVVTNLEAGVACGE